MDCSSSPESRVHEPVLVEEVLRLIHPEQGQVVVDATLGSGGHAVEILKRIGKQGRLIGIDQDPEAIERAKKNLREFPRVDFVQENFSKLSAILKCLNIETIDAVIIDTGVSTEQLEEPGRGFSFLKEGPLDMRMDPTRPLRAWDLIHGLSQEELGRIFLTYGEERWARRIAGAICRERIRGPIETTTKLAEVVKRAVPMRFHFGPRHPATRVFQALRIAVNEELAVLEEGLPQALAALRPGGRLAVIAFHSLEERIVKRMFREWAARQQVRILTRKPLTPSPEEVQRNPRARSAKLRAVEKMLQGEDP